MKRVHSFLFSRLISTNVFLGLLTSYGLLMAPLGFAATLKPILEYRFNETGASALSTGSDTTPVLFLAPPDPGTSADLHTADAGGVSGLVGDRAFDNTSAVSHGPFYSGGIARQSSDNNSFDGLRSFTLTGWLKPDSIIANDGTIISNQQFTAEPDRGFSLSAGTRGVLQLEVDGGAAESLSSYTNTGWSFFAASYDGTRTSNNVAFYQGSRTSGVVQVGSAMTLNKGAVDTESQRLTLGNLDDHVNRSLEFKAPLDARLDNIRIFGSASDNSGVLSAAMLESIRQGDLVNKSGVEGIAPIAEQKITGTLDDYSWNYRYRVRFDDSQELVARIRVKLTGDPAVGPNSEDLRAVWETGIESHWNGQYRVVDGGLEYPIKVDVVWTDDNPDYVVNVHTGTGAVDALNFYTVKPAGWPDDMQGAIAAHEAGHWLGLYDEYNPNNSGDPAWWPLYRSDGTMLTDFWDLYDEPNGAPLSNWQALSQAADMNALMARNGEMEPRYYDGLIRWLEGVSGKDLTLSQAPTFSFREPMEGFADLPPASGVPEPGTFTLTAASVWLLGIVAWRRRVRKTTMQ